jgi:DNA-binding XRE family transcriptional regulator
MDPEPNQGPEAPTTIAEGSVPTGSDSTRSAEGVSSSGTSSRRRNQNASRMESKAGAHPNNVRKLRQGAMMSKAELARRAGVSPLTIDRVEAGCPCRMDTKRKILEALGLQPVAAKDVFPDVDLG